MGNVGEKQPVNRFERWQIDSALQPSKPPCFCMKNINSFAFRADKDIVVMIFRKSVNRVVNQSVGDGKPGFDLPSFDLPGFLIKNLQSTTFCTDENIPV